jgi:hypothetical protein
MNKVKLVLLLGLFISISFFLSAQTVTDYFIFPESDYQLQKKLLKKLDVKKVEVNVLRNTDSAQGIIETWQLDRGNLIAYQSIQAPFQFKYTKINGQTVIEYIETEHLQRISFSYLDNNKMKVRFQRYQSFKDDFDKGTLYTISYNDQGKILKVYQEEDQYDAPPIPKINFTYLYHKKSGKLIGIEAENLEDKTKKKYKAMLIYDNRGYLKEFKDSKKTITYTYFPNGLIREKSTDYGRKRPKIKRYFKYYM